MARFFLFKLRFNFFLKMNFPKFRCEKVFHWGLRVVHLKGFYLDKETTPIRSEFIYFLYLAYESHFFLNWKKRFSVEKLISRQKATRELRIESLKSNVLCVVVEQIMQWCWLSFPSPSIFCSFPGYRLDRTATQRFFLYIETLLDSIFGCRRSFSKRIWQQKFVILAKEARRF